MVRLHVPLLASLHSSIFVINLSAAKRFLRSHCMLDIAKKLAIRKKIAWKYISAEIYFLLNKNFSKNTFFPLLVFFGGGKESLGGGN